MYYLSLAFISIGALSILICCLKCHKLNKKFVIFKDYKDSYIKSCFFNLVMLALFFICYIVFDVLIFFAYIPKETGFLVACILFSVSILIYVNTSMQAKMHLVVNKAHLETIKCLVSSVEARDMYTKGHSEHVSNLVSLIYCNLPKAYKKKLNFTNLRTAGLLHDIGKIGVPENILNKNAALTPLEWTYIEKHPLIGKKILSASEHLNEISDWIYYHHERIDGNGYYKIKDIDIPIAARIIAIADTYSALVTARPYRCAMEHESAITILKEASGTQLDAYLVGIFCYIDELKIAKCNPIEAVVEAII